MADWLDKFDPSVLAAPQQTQPDLSFLDKLDVSTFGEEQSASQPAPTDDFSWLDGLDVSGVENGEQPTPQRDALREVIGPKQPSPPETSLLAGIPRSFVQGAAEGVSGALTMAAETTTGRLGKEFINEAFRRLGVSEETIRRANELPRMEELAAKPGRRASRILRNFSKDVTPVMPDRDSIWKDVGQGEYASAGKKFAFAVSRNIPQLLALALTQGGSTGLSLLGSAAAGQKLQQLEESAPGMNPVKMRLNAIGTGLVEALSERLGSAGLIRRIAGRQAFKGGFKAALAEIVRDSGIEGAEEAVAQIGENALDIMSKLKRPTWKGLFEGVPDAVTVGAAMGGGMGTVGSVISNRGAQEVKPPPLPESKPPARPEPAETVEPEAQPTEQAPPREQARPAEREAPAEAPSESALTTSREQEVVESDRVEKRLKSILGRAIQRHIDEGRAQDVLDHMEDTGRTPEQAGEQFWNETYFALPAETQQRFQRYAKNLVGLEPGGVTRKRPDGTWETADDWVAVGKFASEDLGNDVEYLEGIERGFVALMEAANMGLGQQRTEAPTAPTPKASLPPAKATSESGPYNYAKARQIVMRRYKLSAADPNSHVLVKDVLDDGGGEPRTLAEFEQRLLAMEKAAEEGKTPAEPTLTLEQQVERGVEVKAPAESEPEGKPRRFLKRTQEAEDVPEDVLQRLQEIEPQTYEQHRTSAEVQQLTDWVGRSPENQSRAEERVYSDEPVSATKAALGVALLENYRATGNVDAEVRLTEHLDRQFREAGRFIQAASYWAKLTPKGWQRAFDRLAERNKVEIPDNVRDDIHKRFADAVRLPEGAERDAAMTDAINYAATFVPLRIGEWLEAYRYNNMLSSPQTTERNTAYNLFNAFITRSLALTARGRVKEAGRYVSDVVRGIPSAIEAFRESMARAPEDSKWTETGHLSALELARMEQLPKSLTWFIRFMDAQDKLVRSMIVAGEQARLIRNGVAPEKATQQANDLASEYLLRKQIGDDARDPNQPLFVRALDALGVVINKGRKVPVLGKPWGWFVPFVRTPINWAKMGVKASPLAYIGGRMDAEGRALANVGSLVTLVGAGLAAAGRTTWRSPRKEEDKKAFYDSGRKPFSILIGDKENGYWVPMWYFGPFAFALAIPAAIRDAWLDDPRQAGESNIKKIGMMASGLAEFFTSQTPLHNVSGFLRLIGGEEGMSKERILAFTSGQFIPASGLVRYVSNWIDPIHRRPRSFSETLKRDLPYLSREVEPYTSMTGEPARRSPIDQLVPFPIGHVDPDIEAIYEDLNRSSYETAKFRRLAKREEREMMKEYWKGLR